jgi:hypothetical protein
VRSLPVGKGASVAAAGAAVVAGAPPQAWINGERPATVKPSPLSFKKSRRLRGRFYGSCVFLIE